MHTARLVRTKDVMSRDVVTVRPADTVREALDLMVENKVSALPVVDRNERCVGMVSTTDLIGVTQEFDAEIDGMDETGDVTRMWIVDRITAGVGGERVDGVMTETVAAIGPETSLAIAAREFLRNRVHRLPVVDRDQRLVGILSTMDLLNAFAEQE